MIQVFRTSKEVEEIAKENARKVKDDLAPHPALVEGTPSSIYNVLPDWFAAHVRSVPVEYLLVDAQKFRSKLKPSLYLESLRTAFWLEYNQAILHDRKMDVKRLYVGFVSREYYFSKIVGQPEVFAFVLTPPVDYALGMEAMLKVSLERMHELITLPLYNSKGEVDPRIAALVLKAHESLMYRQFGAPVNRNINIEKKTNAIPSDIELSRLEAEMDSKLEKTAQAIRVVGAEIAKVLPREEELDEYEQALVDSREDEGSPGEGSGA